MHGCPERFPGSIVMRFCFVYEPKRSTRIWTRIRADQSAEFREDPRPLFSFAGFLFLFVRLGLC
jgi:hypothetical protein